MVCCQVKSLGAEILLSTVLALAVVDVAAAQKVPREQAIIGDTVSVAPNPAYLTNGMGRFVFGTEWRALWAIPVEVPVLDIGTFAGGLTPLKTGGFGQTTSLHMRGADGIRYVFRSLDKSPERGLPDDLKNTFVADVMRDQISSQHPYASLVVPDILTAVGILHVTPTLYIMPDDPRLGEYRDAYAGLVGAIEERPNEAEDGEPGFAGADKVKSSDGMYDDLEKHGYERVDEREFLKARLIDVFLGDRDRHYDQWRWARFDNEDGTRTWFPIPKDRDQAFKVNDGLMMTFIRWYAIQYTSFGLNYADIEGQTYNGRELDRRLLVGLESSVWDSTAAVLQSQITDEVIETAVGKLPPEVFAVNGERLIQELKSRRDQLPDMARDYYRLLAEVVDLHSSDDADVATVDRRPDGRIHVKVETQAGAPYFEREFLPEETREIRILTHGGDDSLVVSGTASGKIVLRMLPGGGDDVMIDHSISHRGTKTRWYDHRGDNRVDLGKNAKLDDGKPYEDHPDEKFQPPSPEDRAARSEQTYGTYWYPVTNVSYAPDFGGVFTGGVYKLEHGFRRLPYRYKWSLEGTVTTSLRGKVVTRLDVPDFGPGWESHYYAHLSGLETIRFNGFGNESELDPDKSSDHYKTKTTEITGTAFFTKHFTKRTRIDFGPFLTWARDEAEAGEYIFEHADSLFGAVDKLVLAGLGASVAYDTRDNAGAAQRGVYLNLQGRGIPKVFGANDSAGDVGGYGQIFGSASVYLTPHDFPTEPTLAARVGGAWVGGDYPFYRASFLGGTRTIRGYRQNRFAGDAVAYGNAELRLKLASFPLIFPWDGGIYGFFDGGRVWYDKDPDSANTIHTGYGGGLWFSVLHRFQTFRVGLGHSVEGTLFYFGSGFHF